MADPPRLSLAAARPGAIGGDRTVVLIAFSAIFLVTTVISGIAGDYYAYVREWRSVLSGHDPWQTAIPPFNAYGPLFTLMAPAVWLSPLANKLFFSLAYVVYLVWLTKVVGPARKRRLPAWLWLGLFVLNPFPWEQIVWMGYFDILIGLACVAAIHSLIERRERLSGVFLSLGILLKFMPVILLPFLAFKGRRFHWRLVGACVTIVAPGVLASVLLWGPSTFTPLAFAATRGPEWSIYNVANSAHPQAAAAIGRINIAWLEKPLILIGGTAVFILYLSRRLALLSSATLVTLATLLFYREGFVNYQMVVFCLATYWIASAWEDDNRHRSVGLMLIAYFAFMTLSDLVFWEAGWRSLLHPHAMILCAFATGCVLLIALLRLAVAPKAPAASRT